MNLLKKLLEFLFVDKQDGTISQTKLASWASSIFLFLRGKGWAPWPAETDTYIISALVIWLGTALKDAIAKTAE